MPDMARMNPFNSALRFLIEVAALIIFGVWGYHLSASWIGIVWAILLPLGFALIWGVFAVKKDPGRSGKTVVPTPGWLRLIIEVALFVAAAWMLFDLGYTLLLWIYAFLVFLHHLISYNRINWLIRQ